MKTKITLFTVAIMHCCGHISAQALIPDSLFGTNSIATYAIPTGPEISDVILMANDYILYGGYNYESSQNDFYIDMVKADYCGVPDSTFGVNGLVHYKFSQRNMAYDFHIQADGKILSCGIQSTSNAGSGQIPYVSRFLANGDPDTTFGTAGSNTLRFDPVSSGRFFTVIELPDERVVCMGYSSGNINGGTAGIGAMRFTANGVLDSTFSGDGIVRYDISIPNNLGDGFVSANGDVIAAGAYYDGSFNSHFQVVVWDSTGTLNPGFATGGIFRDSLMNISAEVHAVQDSNSTLTLASSSGTLNTDIHLLRLTAAGTPDPGFGINGYSTISHPNFYACRGIQILDNGQLLILGQSNINPLTGCCMMVNADGSVDTTFGTQGFLEVNSNNGLSTHYVRGMVELPNGQWVFGGNGTGLSARRFTDVSDVPHITQVFNYLETTGTGTYQWYFNGNPIAGATSDTLNFTQNGDYTVLLTGDYGCTYMSAPYTVTNVGLVESQPLLIIISPTLVDNVLFITNQTGESGEVSLTTPEGKLVYKMNLQDDNIKSGIDVSHLSAGFYFVSISTRSFNVVEKIIKKK